MTQPTTHSHWTPAEPSAWFRFAYGRCVMLRSKGGTLSKTIDVHEGRNRLYLRATIDGQILVEVYANGTRIMADLVTNDELDRFVDLPVEGTSSAVDVDVQFIPATFGEVRIKRAIQLVGTDEVLPTLCADTQVPPMDALT